MNNALKYIIALLAIVLVGGLLYFLGSEDEQGNPDSRRVKMIDWEKNYESTSKHPYGTYLLRELLNNGLPNHEVKDIDSSVAYYFNNDSAQIKSPDPITYFFVGQSLNLYNHEVDSLLNFAEKGNNLFIAAENIPFNLLNRVMGMYGSGATFFTYKNDTAARLTFESEDFNKEYAVSNIENHIPKTRRWRVFNYGITYNEPVQKLGKANYSFCFKKFQLGEGSIIIHTIPQVFTNQFLKSEQGKEYVEVALSYFNKGKILWDNHTKYVYSNPDMEIDRGNDSNSNGMVMGSQDKLNFILTNPSLKRAYLVIIIAFILFVVFVGKRQQKVIPTAETNNNSSLEFTETLGRLYLKQGQHNKLIKHMENIFKDKMRNKYFINYTDDSSYTNRLSKKSGVPKEEITKLLNLFKGGSNITNVSDEYLINLYKQLNDFYKKAN